MKHRFSLSVLAKGMVLDAIILDVIEILVWELPKIDSSYGIVRATCLCNYLTCGRRKEN